MLTLSPTAPHAVVQRLAVTCNKLLITKQIITYALHACYSFIGVSLFVMVIYT